MCIYSLYQKKSSILSEVDSHAVSSVGAASTEAVDACGDHSWCNEDCSEMQPIPFFVKRKVKFAVCGEQHILVKSNSELLSWGINTNGQLGIGSTFPKQLPVPVKLPIALAEIDLDAAIVSTAGKHVGVAIKKDM